MKFSSPFEKLNKNDANIAGGKGASLGEMTQAGIPVPEGFVVLSTTFDHFLHKTDLTQEIDAILQKVDHKAIHTVESASKKIRGLIEEREISEDIASEVKGEFKKLGVKFVAVRSSATAEDGAEHAWAGQLESFLNTTEENLLENVKKCWSSLFTPRAIFYRFEKELHGTQISVAVVVQKMIQSDISGIAFSVHPITEDHNQLIIEAGFGLGEAIVSGAVTPDSYVVKKEPREIIDINVNTQKRGLFGLANGGNEWKEIREPQASSQVLNERQISELANLVIKIENHYSFPCDIEWAFKGGKFHIVQSRPITTLQAAKEKTENVYKLIMALDQLSVLNMFNLKDAGWARYGGVLTSEHNKKVSLYIKTSDLIHYGKVGYKIFSSKNKTQRLVDDITGIIEEAIRNNESLVDNNGSYSDKALAEHLKVIYELFVRFFSLYGLIENHYTYYTEDVINQYINLNNEGLKNKPIFDVIFDELERIKDPKMRELCNNMALLAKFKLSTKEKMHVFKSYSAFVREASKRFNLSPTDDVKILSSAEIQSFLMHGFDRVKFDQITAERKDWCAIRYENNEIRLLSGKEAKQEIENIRRLSGLEEHMTSNDGLKGQTASVGLYTGRAVVIPYIKSTEDEDYKIAFAEFKYGDILVTKTSVPEIIEIIKKAAAIVTEEGALTCHGAIMAREFKVPGIVGVDGVVDAIKTGDIIEVDARGAKGFVRKA